MTLCTAVLAVEILCKGVIRVHFRHMMSTELQHIKKLFNCNFDNSTFITYTQNALNVNNKYTNCCPTNTSCTRKQSTSTKVYYYFHKYTTSTQAYTNCTQNYSSCTPKYVPTLQQN